MILYIALGSLIIACLEGFGLCSRVSVEHMYQLIIGGFVELIFEIPVVIKIYRTKGK
jgi:predicted ABC-type sugar transport system permease subunit